MNGFNAGERPVQLNLVVSTAPIVNVPEDIINSNFGEWMKTVTDSVSVGFSALRWLYA